jgi:hypothetical protein
MLSSAKRNSPVGRFFDSLNRFFDAVEHWVDGCELALKRCEVVFGRAVCLAIRVAGFASLVYVVCYIIVNHISR